MKYYIEFLNISKEEKLTFSLPIIEGKIKSEKDKLIKFEISLDDNCRGFFIKFGDADFFIEMILDDVIDKARQFFWKIKKLDKNDI